MSKQIIIMITLGVLFLIIFSYFAFGLGNTSGDSPPDAAISTESPASEAIPESLKIEDLKPGTGEIVKKNDNIVIHYIGVLEDGTKFDSSYDRGEPFETQIGVGNVIKGWDLGVIGMKVGGKRKLTIPPDLGYGAREAGKIPPNSVLIFEVELMGIK